VDKAHLEEAIERINIVLDAETVLFKIGYKVDAIVQSGTSIKAFCPIHKDSMIRSLQLDPNKRRFRCSYYNCKGNKGGTFFELFCLAKDVPEAEGVRILCEELGLELDLPPHLEEPARKIVAEEEIPDSPSEAGGDALGELDLPIVQDFLPAGIDDILDDRAETEPSPSAPRPPVAIEAQEAEPADGSPPPAAEGYDEWLATGTEAFESNKYHRAYEDFLKAAPLAPGAEARIQCEIMAARCLIHLRKTSEALAVLQEAGEDEALADNERKEILYRMAEAYERSGRMAKAVEVLDELNRGFGAYRDSDSRINRLRHRQGDADPERKRESRISFI
jgi:hypothetical protein